MRNTITKPHKPALFTDVKKASPQHPFTKTNDAPPRFQKHNFFVDINGTFKPFTYYGDYDGDFVSIRVKNCSTNEYYLKLDPTITKICKKAVEKRYGTINISNKVVEVPFEDFCDALYDYICEEISESESEF